MMILGFAGTGWLIRGPQKIGSVTFDVDTLVYTVISVLIGFQSVSIALFARIFAVSCTSQSQMTETDRATLVQTAKTIASFEPDHVRLSYDGLKLEFEI